MAYYDFPHTRNYDTDLGYLIKLYREFSDSYKTIQNDLNNLIMQLLAEGKIKLTAKYDSDNKSLSFDVIYTEDNINKEDKTNE